MNLQPKLNPMNLAIGTTLLCAAVYLLTCTKGDNSDNMKIKVLKERLQTLQSKRSADPEEDQEICVLTAEVLSELQQLDPTDTTFINIYTDMNLMNIMLFEKKLQSRLLAVRKIFFPNMN